MTIDTATGIMIIALIVELLGVIAAAVWAVGRINATADVLAVRIDALNELITSLGARADVMEANIAGVSERVAKVETRIDHPQRRSN